MGPGLDVGEALGTGDFSPGDAVGPCRAGDAEDALNIGPQLVDALAVLDALAQCGPQLLGGFVIDVAGDLQGTVLEVVGQGRRERVERARLLADLNGGVLAGFVEDDLD